MNVRLACTLVATLAAATIAPFAPAHAVGVPGTTLSRRIRASGRAEARFVRETPSLDSSAVEREPGRLALERPGLVSVTYTRTSERITLRPDGGEWLSPKLHQLLRIEGERLPSMSQWWRLIVEGSAPGIRMTIESQQRLAFDFVAGDSTAQHATLDLGVDGLPTALAIQGGDRYRFSGWSFARARGAAWFTQKAPAGYDEVTMP